MEQHKLDRINALARKKKAEGLTPAEIEEQAILRREYINAVTGSLEGHLANTSFLEPDGTTRKLQKKETE